MSSGFNDRPLAPFAGILSLGIGDTMVSLLVAMYYYVFFISKNDIYTKGYSMQEKHRANPKITRRRKQRKNIKENQKIC